jgi:hypothetical protein
MADRNADGTPTGVGLRQNGAIPYVSQIPNDSTYPGDDLKDALDTVYTTVGVRLRGVAEDLELQTLNDEQTAVLGGTAITSWVPTMAVVHIKAITGAANGDAEITIGTTTGGTDILTATALTGVNALDEKMVIDLSGTVRPDILANATIYVKCTTADTGAGTALTADVYLYGEVI